MGEEKNNNGENKKHEKEEFKITVNGREKIAPKRELDFEDVVKLAYDNADFSQMQIIYTVTYKQPRTTNEGSLVAGGEPVEIEKGMVFNVAKTDKS